MPRILVVFFALTAAACASSGAIPQPFPAPSGRRAPAPPQPPSPSSQDEDEDEDGYAIAGTALSLRGIPYRPGGTDPSTGFDCSGLVWYVFAQHGMWLPRTVSGQFAAGTSVESRDIRAGDLVFFNTAGTSPSHVGISIGGDEFVHAPSATGEVRVERLGGNYWGGRFAGARRIT